MNLIIILSAKYLFLVSVLIFIIYWLKVNRKIKKDLLIFSIFALPLSLIIAKISALFIKDPRPFVVEHIKPLIPHIADNGFPSDHTLLTMAIASVIFYYNKKLGIILYIIAIVTGVSRVLAKVHHPLDIIGSTIIAIVVTYLVSKIKNIYLSKVKKV